MQALYVLQNIPTLICWCILAMPNHTRGYDADMHIASLSWPIARGRMQILRFGLRLGDLREGVRRACARVASIMPA
jgi:hypothetical protein